MLDDTKYGVATHCPGITGPIHQTAEGPVEAAKRRGEIREHLVEAAPVFPSWVASRLVGDHSHDHSPLSSLVSVTVWPNGNAKAIGLAIYAQLKGKSAVLLDEQWPPYEW
jgi:hypothetical protein